MTLENPDRANLVALILHRLLSRARGPFPKGTILVRAGKMAARAVFDENPRVIPGDGPASCRVEAGLGVLTRVLSGEGYFKHWLAGRVRVRGNPFKGLKMLKALRAAVRTAEK